MTTTHANLALVEGEVHIFSESGATECDYLNIIASTKYIENVPQLDRKHFVKPKVDVGAKATEIFESSHLNLSTDFIIGYRFGYTDHAKEAEFTREDMENAMNSVVMFYDSYPNLFNIPEYIRGYLDGMQKLSLPKSVTLNENNEVISVEW